MARSGCSKVSSGEPPIYMRDSTDPLQSVTYSSCNAAHCHASFAARGAVRNSADAQAALVAAAQLGRRCRNVNSVGKDHIPQQQASALCSLLLRSTRAAAAPAPGPTSGTLPDIRHSPRHSALSPRPRPALRRAAPPPRMRSSLPPVTAHPRPTPTNRPSASPISASASDCRRHQMAHHSREPARCIAAVDRRPCSLANTAPPTAFLSPILAQRRTWKLLQRHRRLAPQQLPPPEALLHAQQLVAVLLLARPTEALSCTAPVTCKPFFSIQWLPSSHRHPPPSISSMATSSVPPPVSTFFIKSLHRQQNPPPWIVALFNLPVTHAMPRLRTDGHAAWTHRQQTLHRRPIGVRSARGSRGCARPSPRTPARAKPTPDTTTPSLPCSCANVVPEISPYKPYELLQSKARQRKVELQVGKRVV